MTVALSSVALVLSNCHWPMFGLLWRGAVGRIVCLASQRWSISRRLGLCVRDVPPAELGSALWPGDRRRGGGAGSSERVVVVDQQFADCTLDCRP